MGNIDVFREVQIDDLMSLHSHRDTHFGDLGDWIFRGQSDAAWKLTSNLERLLDDDLSIAPGIEFRIVREFMRRAHHYFDRVPDEDRLDEWLALMRHYGAPTRLLDWTYSFDIALHFAIRDSLDGPAAIWAINLDWLLRRFRRSLPKNLERQWRNPNRRKRKDLISNTFRTPRTLVTGMTPFYLNERLTIQQGTFLIPCDVSKPFEENLSALDSATKIRGNIVKIVFDNGKILKPATEYLTSVNITEATLFPGVDGFSRSLRAWAIRKDFKTFPPDVDVFRWAISTFGSGAKR